VARHPFRISRDHEPALGGLRWSMNFLSSTSEVQLSCATFATADEEGVSPGGAGHGNALELTREKPFGKSKCRERARQEKSLTLMTPALP
jgi:hypothetical protein